MGIIRRIGFNMGMVVVLLFFFCLSIFLVINLSPVLYWISINYFHLTLKVHLDCSSLMNCYLSMLSYLQSPWESKLRLIDFYSSTRGMHHFRDVKYLFMLNEMGVFLFGFLSLSFFKFSANNGLLWRLIIPLRMAFTLLLTFFCIVMIDFQSAFILFHKLFFRNQDWIFHPASDPVILVLPFKFFMLCFGLFFVVYGIWLLVGIGLGRLSFREG